jgi:hypothetical protein
MHAYDTGRDYGLIARIRYMGISRERFEDLGEVTAKRVYKNAQKQALYLQGWMLNFKKPHPADCSCLDCTFIRENILLY